jgi:rubredoxin
MYTEKHKCQNPATFDPETPGVKIHWKCPECGEIWTMTKTKFRFTKSTILFWQKEKVNPINQASF